ncbi:MAG: hypothetical protein K2X03_15105 [Bryobacteraceae bacterium]|nr:hypothetical protein [Bryobacteraceae bacterium]
MRRLAVLLAALAVTLAAAQIKLYLKDGTHQMAREYAVNGDRVRYYSIERQDWEELPKELVDFTRTEGELKQKAAARAEEDKLIADEDRVEREERARLARIPADPGVYYEPDPEAKAPEMRPLKLAESKFVTNKRRSILKVMSPLPIVNGKATVEIDGEHSLVVIKNRRPEFYFRLSDDESFNFFKLTPGKNTRIVEKVTIAAVVNEKIEEPLIIEAFRQQLADRLFKMWPTADLEPGEYALVQYTEGKMNLQIWDFRVEP